MIRYGVFLALVRIAALGAFSELKFTSFGWLEDASAVSANTAVYRAKIIELEEELAEMKYKYEHVNGTEIQETIYTEGGTINSEGAEATISEPTVATSAEEVKEATSETWQQSESTADAEENTWQQSDKVEATSGPTEAAPQISARQVEAAHPKVSWAEPTEGATPPLPPPNTASPPGQEGEPRVAIYMTTHVSKQHKDFLAQCWPSSAEHLSLVRNADLLVYTSSYNHSEDWYFTNVGCRNTTFLRHEAYPYQYGAIMAMVDPFKPGNEGWFDKYDWVIRLNPDVLIRRQDWLLKTMKNPDVDAILVNRHKKKVAHSDFYAWRPKAANGTAFLEKFHEMEQEKKFAAEGHVSIGFWNLIETERVAWLPGTKRQRAARVIGQRADVLHIHGFEEHCPYYFNASNPKKGYRFRL